MDLVASCKDKLTYFRIKELKDVLTQLGLSKQGKKQDLVDRILSILSDDRVPGVWAKKNVVGKEDVAKSIDDIYRRMQGSGATDLASKSQAVSDSSTVKPNEETIEDSYQIEKVRCLCGSSLQTESMIQCEDPKCHVWQHINCVIIPEKPMEGVLPPSPDFFNCELCRLNQADPFWLAIAHPLYPVKLSISNIPADGTNPVQSIEKNFQLTRADKDLLMKQEYDLQAWCMLLNDKVPFRMQWPQYADLQINGMPVRAINRPGSQLLGANGRDDGPIITPCTRDGINKISLTGCDARIFCLGVRIVKRRTLQQILNMIPKEAEGEPFDDALARVLRCVGGGAATEQADSDSDLEVVADFISVNLRCPMSGSRMKVAGRFKPCVHMGCFDLNVFVEMNQRSRKWQCPVCLKNYSLDKIIIDPYFNRITSKLMDCGEDVTEIEVKPDGCWRAKGEGDRRGLQELGMWHSPDGGLCLPTEVESKPNLEVLRQVKQENGSEGHAGLKLGMKKNPNGFWEIRQPDEVQKLSSGNILSDNLDNHFQNIIPMSSSDTESGINGDDASVNQTGGGGGNVDFSANNGIEFDSVSLNVNSAYAFANQNTSAAQGDADIIVLSDSDDEAEPIISTGVVCKNNQNASSGVHLSVPTTGIPAPYNENHTVGAGSTSCLDLFNGNEDDDIGMHMWTMPSTSQGGSTFPLFNSDANVSALASVQIGAISCPTSMNNYSMTTDTPMDSAIYVPNYSGERLGGDISNSLVDNPLAFGRNDPSLQIFLPTRASDVSSQADQIDKADVHNGVHNEDWISLSLGGGGGLGELAAENRINEVHLPSKRGTLDSLANTATSLPGMNENGLVKSSKENTDSPFHFPRQRRSVRPRLYLSIDSESE